MQVGDGGDVLCCCTVRIRQVVLVTKAWRYFDGVQAPTTPRNVTKDPTKANERRGLMIGIDARARPIMGGVWWSLGCLWAETTFPAK